MYTIEVSESGALMEGRGPEVVRYYTDRLQSELGQQALSELHQLADVSFRHPTPYYETQLTMQRHGPDVVVHDRGVIYGPWLEGVSPRNAATRFKGYHMFRRVGQHVEGLVQPYAERIFQQMRGWFE